MRIQSKSQSAVPDAKNGLLPIFGSPGSQREPGSVQQAGGLLDARPSLGAVPYPRSAAIPGATCASRPSALPNVSSFAASRSAFGAHTVACPTLRPGRADLP